MNTEPLNRELLEMFAHEVDDRSFHIENLVLALEQADGSGDTADLQKQLLKTVHSLKGAAGLMQVHDVENLCHWMEEILSASIKERGTLEARQLDLFLAAADRFREAARSLRQAAPVASAGDDLLEAMKLAAQESVRPKDKRRLNPQATKLRANDMDGSVRVSAERLDALLYRSGELLTFNHALRHQLERTLALREQTSKIRVPRTQARELASIERGLRELVTSLRQSVIQIQRTSAALDGEVRQARTLPFSDACKGLPRIVRDISEASGKLAEIEVSGGDIQIDRSILSGMQDSLRHLVRNAIDHGIEPPQDRRAAGKPQTGKIRISAAVSGDRIQVRVEDDGRGIDLMALRDAAGGSLSDAELLQHVFKPGFSTSRTVTRVSGRGMGLDIVKTAVERLRGTANVSQLPAGGTAFVLTIPLTVSTVRVLQVISAGHVFALDTTSVQHVISVNPEDITAVSSVSTVHGEIPAIDLAHWLGLAPIERPATMRAVVIGAADRQVAVLVDEIAGERELLARTLSPRLANIRHYCGAMNLPDGQIALLLNAAALAEAAVDQPLPDKGTFSVSSKAKPARVLVVDDSRAVRTLIRLIVEQAGYDVIVASNGAEALRRLANQEADIIVSDIDMPEMDGLELVEIIRRSERFADLPIILITGRETDEAELKGLAAGANAYLSKNRFDAQEFLETMRRVF